MQFIAVAIDRTPLLAFRLEQDHLFLTLQVIDDSGQRALWIKENELRFCTTPWDIELVGCNLTIRERQRDYLIDIVFNPPSQIEVRKGRFSLNGLEVIVQHDCFCYANTCCFFKGMHVSNFEVGLMIGEPFETGGGRAFCMAAVNRGKPNRKEIQKWMRDVGNSNQA
jgi:hypothetical protein